METKKGDIREELGIMMADVQQEIASLIKARDEIDEKLKTADSKLAALRTVYDIQSRRLGEYKVTMFPRKGTPSRFAGMRLVDALAIIRQENPGIDKRQALKLLEKENFNFKSKRHLNAVHFAWVALNQRKRQGG